MAELAASVLTIAQVVCALFEQTQKAIKYVKEVKAINDPIIDLLAKVRDLHRLTKTVASTYSKAEPSVSSNSMSLRQIRMALVSCYEHLEKLKLLAFELASFESTTLLEKLTIKKRMDRLSGNIEALERDIRWDIHMLHSGLACLNVDLNATRRASESVEVSEAMQAPTSLGDSNEVDVSPISPVPSTLSDADTVFGPDLDLQFWGSFTSQSSSPRPSLFSTASRTPTSLHTPSRTSIRNDSITWATEITPLTAKNEWRDFESHIVKCGGEQERIKEIRKILQQHSDGAALARSTDTADRTPLHTAAQRGDVDLARILIDEYQADIDAQDSKPYSVLDLAVMGKHRSFVDLLLERGVNEDAISARNKPKFREMKRAIVYERQSARTTKAMSRTEPSGLLT